jgi:mRNA interferase HigB
MHVITRKRIKEAQLKFPSSVGALNGWYKVIVKNDFKNFAELKKIFKSVDKVGDLFVFNISGNNLRLIASIHFNRKRVFIRFILSHSEYDKNAWKK